MSSMTPKPGLMANGNIYPARFIKLDATSGENQHALEATAASRTVGISGEELRNAPDANQSLYHAIDTDSMGTWYSEGDFCLLTIGVGGCVAMDLLKPSTNGVGIAVASNNDWYGAMAWGTYAEAELGLVQVMSGFYGA